MKHRFSDMIDLHQLLQLTIAHAKEIGRQPAVLFWGIIFPILMALGLGIAFTKQTDIVSNIAVVGPDTGAGSAQMPPRIEEVLKSSKTPVSEKTREFQFTVKNGQMGSTTFVFHPLTWQEAVKRLKRGNLSIIITATENGLQYHFDPGNPDAQLTYLKLSKILGGAAANPGNQYNENIAPLTVTGTRYIDFLVPGLIATGIMMSCMWGISYGMIEKRAKKLLRRMAATPMRKSHFLASLITVRVVMNFIEAALLFFFSWWAFNISISGGIGALFVVFIAGNIAFGGLAIFVSSHTANTEIGNGILNAVVLPLTVLSGIFFSYHNFPDWSIPAIRVLPLTLLADAMRSIFIEGAGMMETARHSALLTLTGILFFIAGLKIFRWH